MIELTETLIDEKEVIESQEKTQSDQDLFLQNYLAGHTGEYEQVIEEKENPISSAEILTSEEPKEEPKKRGRKPGSKNSVKNEANHLIDSSFLTGSLLLLLVDLIFPIVLTWANNSFDKKRKISPEMLQMTNKQKADLEPLFDKIAEQINLKLDPLTTGLIALAGIYGVNLIAARAEITQENER